MAGLTPTAEFDNVAMDLHPLSFGIGDRFAHQGINQLKAFQELSKGGIHVVPVWNKSNREHTTVGSQPQSVMEEASNATQALAWNQPWHVDADHITFDSVDDYLDYADFFTIDVTAQIISPLSPEEKQDFLDHFGHLSGEVFITGMATPFYMTTEELGRYGDKYWYAAQEAGRIFKRISASRGIGNFIAEVSMDEVEDPQSPLELFVILAMLGEQGVALQTIAPKFTGRFNKGIDYEGDTKAFEREFETDLLVLREAVKKFNLPNNLKLSIHTGSDKFSLYPIMKQLIRKHHTGIHVKTAGTTWLEEAIGLALSGGDGLTMVKSIYREAMYRYEELTLPYENVLCIDKHHLPDPQKFDQFNEEEIAEILCHEQGNPLYNKHIRQLMHTAYKIAAEKGSAFTRLLEINNEIIGRQVFTNLFERHLIPLFL